MGTRVTILNNGNVGVGTVPQGLLHGYDAISGFMHWEYDGVDGTARTVIPNGAGDVVYTSHWTYVVRTSGADVAADDTGQVPPGNSVSLWDNAGNVLTLAVAADGSVTVQRTGGALTYKVGLWGLWI